MRIEHQSYSTNIFRPSPFVYEDNGLLIIATPWGNKDISEDAVKYFTEAFIGQSLGSTPDDETIVATRIEEEKTPLQKLEHALSITNQSIFQEFNQQELLCGAEFIAFYQNSGSLHIVSVGQPGVYLKRSERNLQPLAYNTDLSMKKAGPELKSVLPSNLIGINSKVKISSFSIQSSESDQILLLSRSEISAKSFQQKKQNIDLASCAQEQVNDDPNKPFWVGLINF